MISRIALAILCLAFALAFAWSAMFGALCVQWMPAATPADMAWRWVVALLSLAAAVFGCACFVAAVGLLARPVAWLRDAILNPATKYPRP